MPLEEPSETDGDRVVGIRRQGAVEVLESR
jgi:hypothetical protein